MVGVSGYCRAVQSDFSLSMLAICTSAFVQISHFLKESCPIDYLQVVFLVDVENQINVRPKAMVADDAST